MYNIHRHYFIRKYLKTKNDYFMRDGHEFSQKSEMNFFFITNLKKTYENYLKQPKSMLEWRSIEKLAGNLKLIKEIGRIISHALIRIYSDID